MFKDLQHDRANRTVDLIRRRKRIHIYACMNKTDMENIEVKKQTWKI